MTKEQETLTPEELLRGSFGDFTESLRRSVEAMDSREGTYHTGRQRRVLSVFGKMQLHSMTLEAIVGDVVRVKTALLDHFTVGTIVRSIIDASLMTMYLSEPSLSYASWLLRREVLHLHEMTNRKRFLEPHGKVIAREGAPLPFFETYEQAKKDSRNRISQYCKELGIESEKTKELQKGQWVFIDGGRGAAREAGWDLDAFEFEQAYYSAYVHSHPVSFMKMDEQQISWTHPSDFQRNFVALALNVATRYLDASIERINIFTGNETLDPLFEYFRAEA